MPKRPRIRSARAGTGPAPDITKGRVPPPNRGETARWRAPRHGQVLPESRSDKIRTGGQINRNRQTWSGEDEFVEALRKMRAVERIEEFFRGYWYRRFNANGYKYWTMGASLDHILINRAIHAPPFDPYAAVCDSYDLAIHKGESEVEWSRRMYELLKIEPGTKLSTSAARPGLSSTSASGTSIRSVMSGSIPVEGCWASSETSIPNSAAV